MLESATVELPHIRLSMDSCRKPPRPPRSAETLSAQLIDVNGSKGPVWSPM